MAKLRHSNDLKNVQYDKLHSVVVRGNTALRKLKRLCKETNKKDESRAGTNPEKALRDTEEKLVELKKTYVLSEKKGSLKDFKDYVGDGASWIRVVPREELAAQKSDANRLYQIFVEVKGAFLLELDGDILEGAGGGRRDLFSEKQCRELLAKKNAVMKAQKTEEEQARKAEEKKAAEEERQRHIFVAERNKWLGRGDVPWAHNVGRSETERDAGQKDK